MFAESALLNQENLFSITPKSFMEQELDVIAGSDHTEHWHLMRRHRKYRQGVQTDVIGLKAINPNYLAP